MVFSLCYKHGVLCYKLLCYYGNASKGSAKGLEVAGFWRFMLHVTATPTSAQIAGTKPNPNLVMENQPYVKLFSCISGSVSTQGRGDFISVAFRT